MENHGISGFSKTVAPILGHCTRAGGAHLRRRQPEREGRHEVVLPSHRSIFDANQLIFNENTNLEKNDTAPFYVPTPTPNALAPLESTKTDLPIPQNFTGETSEVPPRLLFLKSERK